MLLAGAGAAGDLAGARRAGAASASRRAAVALFYVGLSSWWVNVDRGADPREMLVSTQSATEVKEVADQVQALADSRGPGKPPLTVTIDSAEGATFPYAWYFRHLAAGYIDLAQAERAAAHVRRGRDDRRGPRAAAERAQRLRRPPVPVPRLVGARLRRRSRPGNLFRYITQRKVWNPTGGMKEWLYVKKGL